MLVDMRPPLLRCGPFVEIQDSRTADGEYSIPARPRAEYTPLEYKRQSNLAFPFLCLAGGEGEHRENWGEARRVL